MNKLKTIIISSILYSGMASAQVNYTYGSTNLKEVVTASAIQTGIGATQSYAKTSSITKVETLTSATTSLFGATSKVDSLYDQMMYSIGSGVGSVSSDGSIKTVAKTGAGSNTSFYTGINVIADGGLNGVAEGIKFSSSAALGMGGTLTITKSAIANVAVKKLEGAGHSTDTGSTVSTLVKSTTLGVDNILLNPFTVSGMSSANTNLQTDTSAQQ